MDPILLDAIEYNGGGINTLLNRGAVKSVQRGVFTKAATGTGVYHTVSISTINPDKALVLVGAVETETVVYNPEIITTELSAESLTMQIRLGYNGTKNVKGSWQVIDFY